MTNRNLLKLKIISTSSDTKGGYILEILRQYCPLLQNCLLSYNSIIRDVTVTQIEIFTKGCQYLKRLYLNFGTTSETATVPMVDNILLYLGSYNPLLEVLDVSYSLIISR